eukprot:scaffold27668_cov75-Phaeocystis_antarctica.AAC.1
MTSMYFGGVVGPDEGLHRLLDKLLLQLRLAEHQAPRPPPRRCARLSKFGRGLDGRDAVDEQLGRLAVQLGLLEDDERLLVYSSKPTVLALAQLGAALQYDLLESSTSSRRRGSWSLAARSAPPSRDDGAAVLVGLALDLGQHLGPEVEVLPPDEVARLLLVQPVAVGDINELAVASAALAGEEKRAAGRALRSTRQRPWNLHERIVHRRLLHALVDAHLEPRLQQLEAVEALEAGGARPE